jgi:hypothetical protein
MATPTELSFQIEDDDGVKGQSLVYASYNGAIETVDALIGEWLALGALLDAVTGGRINKGSITIPVDGYKTNGGWKQSPLTGQSASDVLELVFSNDDTVWTDTVIVPALRDTLVADGKPILTAAGAIDALQSALAGSFTNGYFVNRTGSDLIELVKAFQGVRKHRKQLRANSTARP